MGLAVLPARLNTEIAELEKAYLEGRDISKDETLNKHLEWLNTFKDRIDKEPSKIHEIMQSEIGKVFLEVLLDAGVYKRDEKGMKAFDRFMDTIA